MITTSKESLYSRLSEAIRKPQHVGTKTLDFTAYTQTNVDDIFKHLTHKQKYINNMLGYFITIANDNGHDNISLISRAKYITLLLLAYVKFNDLQAGIDKAFHVFHAMTANSDKVLTIIPKNTNDLVKDIYSDGILYTAAGLGAPQTGAQLAEKIDERVDYFVENNPDQTREFYFANVTEVLGGKKYFKLVDKVAVAKEPQQLYIAWFDEGDLKSYTVPLE